MNVQMKVHNVHCTPNIPNSSTRSHASEGENRTRNRSKNSKCKRALKWGILWFEVGNFVV